MYQNPYNPRNPRLIGLCEVAAEDPNFTNPFMFTGRRFDFETGLYYYRARYYNPYIGRFLQTDPVGYDEGINWYSYCRNNPLVYVDPSGLAYSYGFLDLDNDNQLKFVRYYGYGIERYKVVWSGGSLDQWYQWAPAFFAQEAKDYGWEMEKETGYILSRHFEGNKDWFFWRLKALDYLGGHTTISDVEAYLQTTNRNVIIKLNFMWHSGTYNYYTINRRRDTITVFWHPYWEGTPSLSDPSLRKFPALAGLVHELAHAVDFLPDGKMSKYPDAENFAISYENWVRSEFIKKVPGYQDIMLRPYYR